VEGAGTIFEQHQGRPALVGLPRQQGIGPAHLDRIPTPRLQVTDERARADARGTRIDEVTEGFSGQATLAPVPEDHGRRGAAAQRFGLRDERNVEHPERRLGARRGRGAEKKGNARAGHAV